MFISLISLNTTVGHRCLLKLETLLSIQITHRGKPLRSDTNWINRRLILFQRSLLCKHTTPSNINSLVAEPTTLQCNQLHAKIEIEYEYPKCMKTSSNGNIFHATGHLCWKFTGQRWILRTKASDTVFGVFFDLHVNKRFSKQPRGW